MGGERPKLRPNEQKIWHPLVIGYSLEQRSAGQVATDDCERFGFLTQLSQHGASRQGSQGLNSCANVIKT